MESGTIGSSGMIGIVEYNRFVFVFYNISPVVAQNKGGGDGGGRRKGRTVYLNRKGLIATLLESDTGLHLQEWLQFLFYIALKIRYRYNKLNSRTLDEWNDRGILVQKRISARVAAFLVCVVLHFSHDSSWFIPISWYIHASLTLWQGGREEETCLKWIVMLRLLLSNVGTNVEKEREKHLVVCFCCCSTSCRRNM